MSVVTAHMVYFCAFARSAIFLENARKSGVGRGHFDAGVNGLTIFTNLEIFRFVLILICLLKTFFCNAKISYRHQFLSKGLAILCLVHGRMPKKNYFLIAVW